MSKFITGSRRGDVRGGLIYIEAQRVRSVLKRSLLLKRKPLELLDFVVGMSH